MLLYNILYILSRAHQVSRRDGKSVAPHMPSPFDVVMSASANGWSCPPMAVKVWVYIASIACCTHFMVIKVRRPVSVGHTPHLSWCVDIHPSVHWVHHFAHKSKLAPPSLQIVLRRRKQSLLCTFHRGKGECTSKCVHPPSKRGLPLTPSQSSPNSPRLAHMNYKHKIVKQAKLAMSIYWSRR